jgi:hypothetical protein
MQEPRGPRQDVPFMIVPALLLAAVGFAALGVVSLIPSEFLFGLAGVAVVGLGIVSVVSIFNYLATRS